MHLWRMNKVLSETSEDVTELGDAGVNLVKVNPKIGDVIYHPGRGCNKIEACFV